MLTNSDIQNSKITNNIVHKVTGFMWENCHVITSKSVCIIVCGVSSLFPHLVLYPDHPTYPDGQLFYSKDGLVDHK